MVALCCLIVRTPNLEVATKSLLHQQVKILGSFSAMSHMKVCPYSYFLWCGYFQGPRVLFFTTDEFSVRVTKTTSRISASAVFLPIFDSMNYGHISKKMETNQTII